MLLRGGLILICISLLNFFSSALTSLAECSPFLLDLKFLSKLAELNKDYVEYNCASSIYLYFTVQVWPITSRPFLLRRRISAKVQSQTTESRGFT